MPSLARIVVGIPARFGSQRLPGKPLRMLDGSPMISHVVRAALASRRASQVIVATDHDEIAAVAEAAGARAVLTDSALPSGTDRVDAALTSAGIPADIVVNVQGDEPLLEPAAIDAVADLLVDTPAAAMSTLSAALPRDALLDPSKVKVVCRDAPTRAGADGRTRRFALFFSRAPIGVPRETLAELLRGSGGARAELPAAEPEPSDVPVARQPALHLGLYAFRRESLRRFVSLPRSALEVAESGSECLHTPSAPAYLARTHAGGRVARADACTRGGHAHRRRRVGARACRRRRHRAGSARHRARAPAAAQHVDACGQPRPRQSGLSQSRMDTILTSAPGPDVPAQSNDLTRYLRVPGPMPGRNYCTERLPQHCRGRDR